LTTDNITNDLLLLNIGSGSHKLPGYINVDVEAGADIVADITKGLPFNDNSVEGVYSEHFIEHLSQGDACFFFRECRRILRPGGIVRIATPDLDEIINSFNSAGTNSSGNPLGWLQPDWSRFGFEWIANRCEMLNISMHEWGHQWLYNEEELIRLGQFCGLTFKKRHALCESSIPWFKDLEHRDGSTLIVEFEKSVRRPFGGNPLVSVCIPAYKPQYFKEALDSIVHQTYTNLEIIISDDARHEQIFETSTPYLSDKRFIYIKNPDHGDENNYINALTHATGDYIKFFNDDDILERECIEKLVFALEANPYATLATSTRKQFQVFGQFLPQNGSFIPILPESSEIDSQLVMHSTLAKRINFIGEPNCTLFRREDVLDIKPHLMTIGGQRTIMGTPGDVVMWLNLLSKGNLIYLTDCLSYLRMHPNQVQNSGGYREKGLQGWDRMVRQAIRLGMHKMTNHKRTTIAPLIQKSVEILKPSLEEVQSMPYLLDEQRNNLQTLKIEINGTKFRHICSIIIPVFNKLEFTQKCLQTLIKNTPDDLYEIIIIDNASTDGTHEFMSFLEGDVTVITNETNLGFAKACNQGAQAASGKYLVFLNNDTIPHPGWLTEMIKVADEHEDIGIVGSKLLFPDGKIQHAGIAIAETPSGKLGRHIYYGLPGNFKPANRARYFQAVTGACLLISRDLFYKADGFDERYINGWEDVDLCLKIRNLEKRVFYCPTSVLTHFESQTPGRLENINDNRKLFNQLWNNKIETDFSKYLIQDGFRIEQKNGKELWEYHEELFDKLHMYDTQG
jgi:GT2 family glycosyltransferase/predicted SAM-dependent methyltransferase